MDTDEASEIIDEVLYELLDGQIHFKNKKIILLLLATASELLDGDYEELQPEDIKDVDS